MDSKNDLLKTSWNTLLASFVIVMLLGLASRANAAVDVEHAVAYVTIGLIRVEKSN